MEGMAIQRLLENSTFSPVEVKRMTEAYERVLKELKLADPDDPITVVVAKRIIAITQGGEKDPDAIFRDAMSAVGISPRD